MSESAASISRDEIERLIQMPIRDEDLYRQALSHGSLFRGEKDSSLLSNERLEFLGDAIVDFLIAEHVFHHFSDADEGFLTRVRASIVNGASLAEFATWINLGALVMMSEDMERAGGRSNATILADAFEALVAAIYLDLGKAAARTFLERVVLDRIDIEDIASRRDNYKSILLEYAQAKGWAQPTYRVVEENGPAHARIFTVEVLVGERIIGRGTAGSKKKAEQQAADEALATLQALD